MDRAQLRMQASDEGARGRDARGFTLMETVIALLVMMIVGLGATSLFFYAIRYNQGASERAMAVAVGQQKMEELRALNWGDASLAATAGTDICTSAAPCYSGNKAFTVRKVITDSTNVTVNGSTYPTLKTITISVTPLRGAIPWAQGAISITAQRVTLVHGPYAN